MDLTDHRFTLSKSPSLSSQPVRRACGFYTNPTSATCGGTRQRSSSWIPFDVKAIIDFQSKGINRVHESADTAQKQHDAELTTSATTPPQPRLWTIVWRKATGDEVHHISAWNKRHRLDQMRQLGIIIGQSRWAAGYRSQSGSLVLCGNETLKPIVADKI